MSSTSGSYDIPPKLIKKWNPKFSVRSASQQIMPVKFIGTMVLRPADMPK
jgi:hypothetical protein